MGENSYLRTERHFRLVPQKMLVTRSNNVHIWSYSGTVISGTTIPSGLFWSNFLSTVGEGPE